MNQQMNKMVFSSLHTHTVFCDGKDDVETMCRAAFAKGLTAIGFSSHAPMGKTGLKTSWHMQDERLEAYIDEVHAARRRWEGKIAVCLGLEVDYIRGLRSALDKDIQNLDLDYIIGSVHYLMPPHGDPFPIDGTAAELEKGITDSFGGDGDAMMNAYWDAIAEMVAIGGIHIVGHLDLVKKNNGQNQWFNMEGNDYKQRVAEIVQTIADAGMVVEVNTGGLNRGYFAEICPSPPILSLLRQHNVPVIISADAHNAEDINGHYREARQALLNAGYTNHTVLVGQNAPVFEDLMPNESF